MGDRLQSLLLSFLDNGKNPIGIGVKILEKVAAWFGYGPLAIL